MRLSELRELEYVKRLQVNALRREVFGQSDPTAVEDQMADLEGEEAALTSLRRAIRNVETPSAIDSANASAVDITESTRGAASTGLTADVTIRMAYVPTSFYQFLDPVEQPLASCTVRNTSSMYSSNVRRIRVTSFIEGYSAKAVDTFELGGLQDHTVHQSPTLMPDAIRGVTELTSATLHMVVDDMDATVETHRTERIRLLSRNTAPLAIIDPHTGDWIDLSRYFGAFVTPNAPEIMQFLRTVADHHPDHRLTGYGESEQAVEWQVKAAFDALGTAGITYVNSVIAFSPDDGPASQRVRLPRESLGERQANCIDGTVLMASLLEGISLHPAIVVVPGHAFLGWETDRGSGVWRYVETTMIGGSSFKHACTSADQLAEHYRALRDTTGDPFHFRRWPLNVLRLKHSITPME